MTPSRFSGVVSVVALLVLAGLTTAYFYYYDPLGWYSRPVVVWCAAGLKRPVEAAARAYEKETGTRVELRYGASNTLLAQIDTTGQGDLYVPADDSYVAVGTDKKLLAEVIPLATQRPVVVVPRGNPHGYKSLRDALARGARFSAANPDAAAIGAVGRTALTKAGLWDDFARQTLVNKGTVTEVPHDLVLGAVDAGVVWDTMLAGNDDLEAIPAPELDGSDAQLSACVLAATKQPTAALRFARFLAARDRGAPIFKDHGFTPTKGDRWAWSPEIRFYAGAMLRPAIEETLTEFEQREGCKLLRVYNGCGILISQMNSGPRPDGFFACDLSFMQTVAEQFEKPVDVSGNQLVILVKKGNPHGVRMLKDLGKPGVRVGVGHERQCALGQLTQTTLETEKLYGQVMKNVLVQSPTGDLLVNQLRIGALDAIVAYRSNAAGAEDDLEAYAVDVPCALATQPLAAGKTTEHPQMMARLMAALQTPRSRQRFLDNGFEWKQAP